MCMRGSRVDSGKPDVARVLSFPVGSVKVGEMLTGLWKAS